MSLRAAPAGRRVAWSGVRGPAVVGAGVLAAWAYVGAVDPNSPGQYPVCPFHALTGLWCPLCGGLRCAHALAHGDLAGAAGANLLVALAAPLAVLLWARWLTGALRGARVPPVTLSDRAGLALGALLLGFAVVRNTSWGAALAP